VHTLVFDLIDEKKIEIKEDEYFNKDSHEIKWIPYEKVAETVNIPDDKMSWKYFYESGFAFSENGILINSGKFNGLSSLEAQKEITEFVNGKIVTKFKLRDWVFSRQRYWGEPIPIVNCEKCGLVPVPEKNLPLKLPKIKSYKLTETGESPLAGISKWVNTKCPKCKGKAKRETDTMPNWAGSSWYYLRYTDTKNKKEFASKKNLKYWTPVDWYNGGMEHTTLHLLYSRFWHKFLYDLKLVPTIEPYMKRTSHGMILGEGGVKMSKSLGNVVNPDEIVKTYGADTLRVYEMFMGPFEDAVAWSTESIIGSRRFIEKVWRIGSKKFINTSSSELKKLLHKTIKKVSEDIEAMRFNTAISAMMIFATEMEKSDKINMEDYKKFLQILTPFAPHVTEEIWQLLGEKKTINLSEWPKWDENLIKDDEMKIAVQVNGKVRAEIIVKNNENEEDIKKKALSDQVVSKFTAGKEIKKTIYVKNRLVNIVV
jgi:leucyl-tRNA synthetase